MIIQGTNAPIIFTFTDSMDSILDIEISLYSADRELKHWTKKDVLIVGTQVKAPLTQSESVLFPAGKCNIEVKWMDANGKTNFAKNIQNTIVERFDRTIMEGAE